MTDKKLLTIFISIIAASLIGFFIGLLLEVEILFQVFGYCVIGSVGVLVIFMLYDFNTVNKLNGNLDEEVELQLEKDQLDDFIVSLENRVNTTFFSSYKKSCEVNIIMILLRQDRISELKTKFQNIDNNVLKSTYYYKFLIELEDGNIEEATELAKNLHKLADPLFDTQKANCFKLLQLAKTGKLNKLDMFESDFPIVKRIFKKYSE